MTEDGVNFFTDSDELIFGAYFFLSDVQSTHKFFRFGILTFLSQLGGLFTSLIKGMGTFVVFYNNKSLAGDFM